MISVRRLFRAGARRCGLGTGKATSRSTRHLSRSKDGVGGGGGEIRPNAHASYLTTVNIKPGPRHVF